MSWWRFLLFNALGGALWVITWVSAASFFTTHMSVITAPAHHTKIVAGVLHSGHLWRRTIMALERVAPKLGSLPELRTYKCLKCGHVIKCEIDHETGWTQYAFDLNPDARTPM
jgi:hypothetical protein